MILEWITTGAAIFTALLIVGVQIIFYYAGHFEEEYKDKIVKIQLILNWKLDKELRQLFKSKFEMGEKSTEDREWTPIFPETLDDIRFKAEPEMEIFPEYLAEEGSYELITLAELATINKTVLKLEKWFDCIQNGKKRLRRIGKELIYTGIIILISAILYAISPGNPERMIIILFFLYFITFFASRLYGDLKDHKRIQEEIEDAYKKVQKRSMDL